MIRPRRSHQTGRVSLRLLIVVGSLTSLSLTMDTWAAPPKKGQGAYYQSTKPLAPPPPRSALLKPEDWQKAPLTPVEPGEIDDLIARELEQSKVKPAPLTTDEQFIRRVTLDLTGELPLPADVTEFVAQSGSEKRARLIDKLLASDDFAQHWAQYWTDVITARLPDRRAIGLMRGFEEWMFEELKANKSWDRIARAMITADGEIRYDKPEQNGAAFFLAAHRGADAANERAAETSRVFLGIQIQCAQCHDHPMDQWKRVQFHELAAFYSRLAERPVRDGKKMVGVQLIARKAGEHEMPSKEDPKKGFRTDPQFLDGKSPGVNRSDAERRRALAAYIVDKKDYWFAAAFVNRIWGTLMGQSFYQPVDDMGPKKEAVFPSVLTRLTGSFRGSNYDVKRLFRDIMCTETYQRQIRLNDSSDQHLHFAAAYPTRLRPDSLWESLVHVLGRLGPPAPEPVALKRPGKRGALEFLVKEEFGFDPSVKPDEVEGSISQALLMMNNPVLSQKIGASGTNLLSRILKSYPDDGEALRMVYLRTLARTPTSAELQKCRKYIADVGRRGEAFEDILWTLINSTEFQTKR